MLHPIAACCFLLEVLRLIEGNRGGLVCRIISTHLMAKVFFATSLMTNLVTVSNITMPSWQILSQSRLNNNENLTTNVINDIQMPLCPQNGGWHIYELLGCTNPICNLVTQSPSCCWRCSFDWLGSGPLQLDISSDQQQRSAVVNDGENVNVNTDVNRRTLVFIQFLSVYCVCANNDVYMAVWVFAYKRAADVSMKDSPWSI